MASLSAIEIQHQAELTIALKDVQKEDVAPGGVPYPIFRPDRVHLKTHTADERKDWSSSLMPGVPYGSDTGFHRFARDDHAGFRSLRADALSAGDAFLAQFTNRAEEATVPPFFKGEYGARRQKYFPNVDDGRPGRSKGFFIIEGKVAGILLRCKANIEAAATSPRGFSKASLSLLKQTYAYALAFRTQHVALYDYTTLILIHWPHLDTTATAAQLWTYWNNPVSAGAVDRRPSAITVTTDRDLMMPALAGFMTHALRTCNHRWHSDLES
ncbi:hypothetical protein K4K61_001895 [Colletotrichum sp. SAR11_59]|nr:hypothetical protein K4K61_001895 [Colletotrichum sp. SAR11_59]